MYPHPSSYLLFQLSGVTQTVQKSAIIQTYRSKIAQCVFLKKRKENTLQQNWTAYIIWLLEDEIEEKRLYLFDHSLNILSVLE